MPNLLIARDAALSGKPLASYIGGMRRGYTGLASWSHPLVKLAIYDDGVALGPSASVLKMLVPVWRARFDDISVADAIGGPQDDSEVSLGSLAVPLSFITRRGWGIMTRGVRISTTDRSFAIFWCMKRDRVLAALRDRGVNVDPEPRPFHWFSPRS
jgi:hypothetical protein